MSLIESIIKLTRKGAVVSTNSDVSEDTGEINIPSNLYYMKLAIFTATSIIANAFIKSTIKVYKDKKPVKDKDYYVLNIKANINQSASQFWHKVVTKALTNPNGALVIINNGYMYCADTFQIEKYQPFLGNIYSGISIDGLQLNRKYNANEVMIFKLEDQAPYSLINNVNEQFSKIINEAMQAYGDTNITKYKLKVDGLQAGDEKFAQEFENVLKKPLQEYLNGSKKLYVEYDGRTLEQMKSEKAAKSVDDYTKSIESYFKLVGKTYKIPESLMLGNITNVKDIVNQTLTFAVDPFAEMVSDVLTGAYGFDNWSRGNYYRVDTSSVNHIDLIDMASNISNLVGSSVTSVNEIRDVVHLDYINAEWANKHYLTKNFVSVTENQEMGGNDE